MEATVTQLLLQTDHADYLLRAGRDLVVQWPGGRRRLATWSAEAGCLGWSGRAAMLPDELAEQLEGLVIEARELA